MRLNALFCDGAIFQANKPVRVFGTGGGNIRIDFCGKTYAAEKTGAAWCMELAPGDYGGPYEMTVTMDGRTQVLHDLYFGDVYLLAGQSNMQFKLKQAEYTEDMCEDDALLRLFSTERVEGGERFLPQDGWVKAQKTTVTDWSCIGYFVGRELRKQTGKAIGLIGCYQGAADIQTFLPESAFENPAFQLADKDRFDIHYPWNAGHSQLYNFQVKQILPISLAAVLWYQGESNDSEKESLVYGEMLSFLIASWRAAFQDETLPFAVVQIADFAGRNNVYWHRIQKVQEEISQTEANVSTVISRDVCETSDIHPKKKYELAMRLVKAILAWKSEN